MDRNALDYASQSQKRCLESYRYRQRLKFTWILILANLTKLRSTFIQISWSYCIRSPSRPIAEEALLEEQARALLAESDSFTKCDRLDFDDQDGSSDNTFDDEEEAQPQPTFDFDERQLSTVEDAETLLDALAEHVTRHLRMLQRCWRGLALFLWFMSPLLPPYVPA